MTIRAVSAMAMLAALAAAIVVALPALVNASAPIPADKDDLIDSVDCQLRSWPYYARGCLRDETRNAGRAVKARLVTTDRIEEPVSETTGFAPVDEPLPEQPAQPDLKPQAPSDWMMSDREIRTYIAAGDFIRRTVPAAR